MAVTERVKALWKRVLSYSKKSWDIDDYPLKYKEQVELTGQYNSGKVRSWIVQVINWWTMVGFGDTRQDAYKNLKSNFNLYLEFSPAPRPGKVVPLYYAETSEIDNLEEIAVDFFDKVLQKNYHDCFISDLSSVFDFAKDEAETIHKINSLYHLGLTELGDGNIVRILKTIKNSTTKF